MYRKVNYIKPIKGPENSFKFESLKQAQLNSQIKDRYVNAINHIEKLLNGLQDLVTTHQLLNALKYFIKTSLLKLKGRFH